MNLPGTYIYPTEAAFDILHPEERTYLPTRAGILAAPCTRKGCSGHSNAEHFDMEAYEDEQRAREEEEGRDNPDNPSGWAPGYTT